jgi:hypothetical protein
MTELESVPSAQHETSVAVGTGEKAGEMGAGELPWGRISVATVETEAMRALTPRRLMSAQTERPL